jgi:methylmalonyl-CoA mutase N-terminal domain/subunit
VFQPDPAVERARAEELARWRKDRDAGHVRSALDGLERAARGTENLLPHILAAVEANATLGEISDTMRGVFGVYQPPTLF